MTPPASGRPELILGIESSCDETSVAVLRGPDNLLGHVIHSQDAHHVYGGVVPELAARAHVRRIDAVVNRALEQAETELSAIEAIGVTAGPGLIGALLVGVSWARAAAWALGVPVVGVHHMEAHLFAPAIEDPEAEPPFVALLVSGGHTLLIHARGWGDYRILGSTRDDAAGEAFDKIAVRLGLPYPGGPPLQALAESGDPRRFQLPRPMMRGDRGPEDPDYFDLSFSGLKTATANLIAERERLGTLDEDRADLAASFQEAVVDVLTAKTWRAVEHTGVDRVVLGGGVSANRPLRERMTDLLGRGVTVHAPSTRLALDNGAMIARTAYDLLGRPGPGRHAPVASANLPFPVAIGDDSGL